MIEIHAPNKFFSAPGSGMTMPGDPVAIYT